MQNWRRPVTLCVAPNGGRRSKADNPALPLTTTEVVETASACLEAGASMIHVHVRDGNGDHSLDPDAFLAELAALRSAVGGRLVLQITSESLGRFQPAEQMASVRAVRPEAVSLALRELAPDTAAEPAFSAFLEWLARERIAPQIILYTPEEAMRLAQMQARGLIPFDDIPVLFVLGRYTPGQKSQPIDLLPFLAEGQPRFRHWMTCAFGSGETACVTTAALLGGNARVGMENNLVMPDGSPVPHNASLVAAAAHALAACGMPLGTADGLRALWGIER
ncbi:MAG TPA: 3-keto-5-aminohexanoate cleavage protein [Methylomirabilota bacterium]|nr:3-keto-5-aminohexanoate cleavage protein [Methylomirabilota bacterium]